MRCLLVIWLLLLVADGCGQSGGAKHSGSLIVTVTATPPGGVSGDQALNVNAYHEYGLAGGVTLTVTAS